MEKFMNSIFETVSFHIVKPCNMKCKFCYATFEDMTVGGQMPLDQAKEIVYKLKVAGVEKITFAGGEPMLYRHIAEIIKFTKAIGLTSSIITNGSLLSKDWLREMAPYLDWVGLSIDSLNPETNQKIGRISKLTPDYDRLINWLHYCGYKVKINTVVNSFNKDEDMNEFISWAKPDRWKVFQALHVEGQNDTQFDEIKVSAQEYFNFVARHKAQKRYNLIPESNELMAGSYLLVDPLGRFFENSAGKHTYSDTLIGNSVWKCLSQISLNRETFIDRGGLYNWQK